MNNLLKFLVCFLTILVSKSFAQTITTTDVTLNGQTTIQGCGQINLGSTSTNSLSFFYKVSVNSNSLPTGGTITIKLKRFNYQSGSPGIFTTPNFNATTTANVYEAVGYIQQNVSLSEIEVSGSSIFLEYLPSGSTSGFSSCESPLIKDQLPSFSLSPSSLSIYCGDTSPRTFTVTPANIPAGATVSYQWLYNNAWSGTSNATMNSITLIPSGTSSLSSIYVNTFINGVMQIPSLTCYVTRATFSSAATITGATNICSGTSTYPISGILPGQTVTWSLSNPSIATLSGQSNSQTNVTFNGNGAQTLNATITNTCGQVTTKSFQINTGVTTFTSAATIAGVTSLCSGQSTYTISGITTGQNVTWGLSNPSIATLSGATNAQVTVTFTGSGTQTLSAYITNSCGQTATKTFSIYGGIPVFNNFTYGTSTSTQSICLAGPSSYAYSIPELNATDKIFANFSGLSTAEAGLATNWQWTTSSNIIILNGTKNTRNMCTLAPGTANINVRVKNSCGYSNWAILPVTITELPLVSGRLSKATVFKVYPNPSSDIVNIELKDQNNQPSKETTITGELFDIMGQSKTKIQIIDNKATLSVRGFNKGIYVLKIYINDQIESYQIAVE